MSARYGDQFLANPANVKYQLIGLPNNENLALLTAVVKKMQMKKVTFVT